MHGYKVLTHDYRPPVQGGDPIWDSVTLPHTLPAVALDTGSGECSYGWNYCADLPTALRIARYWPDGRPAVAVRVEASADAIQRGDKWRASSLTITERASDDDLRAAIRVNSAVFGDLADEMAAEQWAWFIALGRPCLDAVAVEAGLRAALAARGLDWSLRHLDNARAAWAAWAAWAAGDAWDAWAARDALTVYLAARRGWVAYAPDYLAVGLRDAYAHGLAIALPTGPGELGWAMEV